MKIFARYGLAAAECARCAPQGGTQPALEPALLLEGSWPQASTFPRFHSLDETIDARFDWIDEEAALLAERAAEGTHNGSTAAAPSAACLNALGLRYYLVKLLRVIAFFQEVAPSLANGQHELFVTTGRDEDYAELLETLGRSRGFEIAVHWFTPAIEWQSVLAPAAKKSTNNWLRRRAAQLNDWLDRRILPQGHGQPRVILLGNPRVLDPVCEELMSRRVDVWWLYDRFAFRSWRRWRLRGVRQLTCNSDCPTPLELADLAGAKSGDLPPMAQLSVRGIRIERIVDRWLSARIALSNDQATTFFHRALEHLRRVSPQALVLDEDATPLARAATAAARSLAIPTCVVQHGVPGVRFGFTPLVADWFCAADPPSRRQMLAWGAAEDRVIVTGSPALEALQERFGAIRQAHRQRPRSSVAQPTFLLLATTPPRDERPDAVALHLTTKTYGELLETAASAVARIPQAKLLIKPHPRDPDPGTLHSILTKRGSLVVETVAATSLEQLLTRVDVVLSCGSTGGIDAAALGWPVIQLLPCGSGDLLPAEEWGMIGTARDACELAALIPRALEQLADRNPRPAFRSRNERPAAARIVDLILNRSAPLAQSPGIPIPGFPNVELQEETIAG